MGNRQPPDILSGSFNEQLYGLFAQCPAPMAILKSREGIFEVINPQFIKILGYRNVLNKPLIDAWPEFHRYWGDVSSRVFDRGESIYHYSYAAEADWKDNGTTSVAYFDFVFSPHINAEGIVDGIVVSGLDVTNRVVTLTMLARQELVLKSVTEAAATALWMIDVHGDITYVSQAWVRWTGKPFETHLGRGWLNSVVEEDREHVFHRFALYFAAKKVYNIDFRIISDHGDLQWIAATGKPRYSADGEFEGYAGSCMDITERKETESHLKESEQRFRKIADTAPVFIWMADTSGKTSFFNKSWLDFTGKTFEESVNTHETEELHPDDKEKVYSIYATAFEKQAEYYLEFKLRRYDGVYRDIGMKSVPRYSPEGEFEGYIGSGMDITETKEHEQIKNEFIGMASHELKTPITSIKAYVQLLLSIYKDHEDEDFLKKSLSTINKQINRLTRLITDLLDVSKIESGRLSLNSEVFVLNDLLKECIDEVQYTAPHHDIVLEEEARYSVYADRDRIAQVITNLLTNAIKYSPETDRIDVSIKNNNGHVRVTVHDYGIGISKTEQEKIFNRFYRVEGRNEQTFSGFGIGLYVAAEIIRRHKGTIWVDSEKGKESFFSFELPMVDDEV
ncbi:PAS domain-containing sensor histidine kinase [Mucilaginibacter agri]|uniref:histidine kinase n=1 Tax=Mucilaginibacter agri TaxID=2695265 RepID=A0A965ZK99_9SPHI|nr:PAS domain-containing sensor histidine kinase [Mucilaginibacter agri]NCD71196.1 PAS domain S-box protein [Mucilaginibacter agri]